MEFQLHFEKDYSATAWIHSITDATTMLCGKNGPSIYLVFFKTSHVNTHSLHLRADQRKEPHSQELRVVMPSCGQTVHYNRNTVVFDFTGENIYLSKGLSFPVIIVMYDKITSLQFLGKNVAAPLGGFLGNWLSCRVTIILGGILSSAGLILSSFASSLEQLYICTGIITGIIPRRHLIRTNIIHLCLFLSDM